MLVTKPKQVERKVIGIRKCRLRLDRYDLHELKQRIHMDDLENEVYRNHNLCINPQRHFYDLAYRLWTDAKGHPQAINFHLDESTTWHSYLRADEPIYENEEVT